MHRDSTPAILYLHIFFNGNFLRGYPMDKADDRTCVISVRGIPKSLQENWDKVSPADIDE